MELLKLGTRRSLLAWAQSGWVARELERLHPGLKVELVGIETRGDKILDIPLSQVEGKEFFVAELDNALRSRAVDFTVHSLKDLSLDRPKEFHLACIPKRENPRDVILFGPGVIEKLKAGRTIRIGSSSPRRLENLPGFLKKALPRFHPDPDTLEEALAEGDPPEAKVEFVEIRGNVNTRLGRVHEPPGSDRHLDGVVLALAGLIRLYRDEKGKPELDRLLKGCRWMIMPLKQCPTAPGQGALAVECRADDERVTRILRALHDEPTLKQVTRERAVLKEWGGGCHQRFGATCIEASEVGELMFIRGVQPDGKFVDTTEVNRPPRPELPPTGLWDGSFWRGGGVEWTFDVVEKNKLQRSPGLFIAHSRAVPARWLELLEEKRIWTSGTASWFRLAKSGLWVEGCNEGFGFEDFKPLLQQPVLGLPNLEDWVVLTHTGGTETWTFGEVLPTYRVVDDREAAAREAMKTATHLFWGSASQYERYKDAVPAGAVHACGPGKTAKHLKARGLSPLIFLSSEEWRKWLAS